MLDYFADVYPSIDREEINNAMNIFGVDKDASTIDVNTQNALAQNLEQMMKEKEEKEEKEKKEEKKEDNRTITVYTTGYGFDYWGNREVFQRRSQLLMDNIIRELKKFYTTINIQHYGVLQHDDDKHKQIRENLTSYHSKLKKNNNDIKITDNHSSNFIDREMIQKLVDKQHLLIDIAHILQYKKNNGDGYPTDVTYKPFGEDRSVDIQGKVNAFYPSFMEDYDKENGDVFIERFKYIDVDDETGNITTFIDKIMENTIKINGIIDYSKPDRPANLGILSKLSSGALLWNWKPIT